MKSKFIFLNHFKKCIKTFQRVKKDPKYRDLWFPNGKEIKSNDVFCKVHNLKEAVHYFKKTNGGTFYFIEDGLERLDELIKRKVSDKTSQSISSTNYTDRKVAESTTSERNMEQNTEQRADFIDKKAPTDYIEDLKKGRYREQKIFRNFMKKNVFSKKISLLCL